MSADTKHRMSEIVSSDPELMHGTPCFRGTRVPVRLLLDDLKSGYTVERCFWKGAPRSVGNRSKAILSWCKTWSPNAPSRDRRVHQSATCDRLRRALRMTCSFIRDHRHRGRQQPDAFRRSSDGRVGPADRNGSSGNVVRNAALKGGGRLKACPTQTESLCYETGRLKAPPIAWTRSLPPIRSSCTGLHVFRGARVPVRLLLG